MGIKMMLLGIAVILAGIALSISNIFAGGKKARKGIVKAQITCQAQGM